MGVPLVAQEALAAKPFLTDALALLGQETLEPTAFLAPSVDLGLTVRSATKALFDFTAGCLQAKEGLLGGQVTLPELHSEGLDAEQIWLQLDMQSQPVLTKLKKRIRKVVRRVEGEGADALIAIIDEEPAGGNGTSGDAVGAEVEGDEASDEEGGPRFDSDDFNEEDEGSGKDEEEMEDRRESGAKAGSSGKKGRGPVEDEFLSLEDMEKFLQDAEEKEQNEGPNEEEEDGEGSEGAEEQGIRYEYFYGRKAGGKRKPSARNGEKVEDEWGGDAFSDDEMEEGEEEEEARDDDDADELEDSDGGDLPEGEGLSAHERRLARTQERIAQLEKANVAEKEWMMAGEAAASKRPLNSALEVDLDFEHAQRPAPVITEEVTASLEDIIKKRIVEGQFDDVVRKASLVGSAPKRREELDESKSQKGLAEIYEEEYMRATAGPGAIAAASGDDVVKREAAMLFKSLCLKLDALSHFTFAPKPVIEDVSVHADVPALAMEEVAPVAVSDANLLAPEEVFAGGDGNAGVRGKAAGAVKAEGELTQEERKSRRAKHKRKRKAEQGEVEKAKRAKFAAKAGGASNSEIAAAFAAKTATKAGKAKATAKGKDDLQPKQAFTKSSQVFARIQEAQDEAAAGKSQKRRGSVGTDDQQRKKQSYKL